MTSFWIAACLLGVTAAGFVLLPLYIKPFFIKKGQKDTFCIQTLQLSL